MSDTQDQKSSTTLPNYADASEATELYTNGVTKLDPKIDGKTDFETVDDMMSHILEAIEDSIMYYLADSLPEERRMMFAGTQFIRITLERTPVGVKVPEPQTECRIYTSKVEEQVNQDIHARMVRDCKKQAREAKRERAAKREAKAKRTAEQSENKDVTWRDFLKKS